MGAAHLTVRMGCFGVVATLASLIVSANAAEVPVTPKPAPPPSDEVVRASALSAAGHREEAIAILELRVNEEPHDSLARQTLLSLRIAAMEDEIRVILNQQAKTKDLVVADPDYEAARARADSAVAKRLDVAEYYAHQRRYPEAAMACNAILKDYPHHDAVLKLKFRVLKEMVERERSELLKEKALRHDDAINDVIDAATLPGELARTKRTVFIFDEDIADVERAALNLKLQQRVDLIYDGTNGTKSVQVREVLQPLFAIAGINYVILDSALGTETLTIHLVHETVETALATISKLVNVRYNYSGGTVFISSATSDVLVTEIIRVRSGLTDVVTEPKFGSLLESGGAGAGGAQGGQPGQPQQAGGGAGLFGGGAGAGGGGGANQQQQQFFSDLERFLDKIPDIVVGWPADGKIYLDKKSNTVYIRSTPSTILEVKRLLQALDYNNTQVLIEARFIQVSDDAAKVLGIDWSGGGQRGDVTLSGATAGLGAVPATDGGASILNGVTSGTGGLFAQVLVAPSDLLKFKAQLNALETSGKTDTLSEPKILTLNNSVGMIEVRQDISYISSYQSVGTSTNPIPGQNNNNNNFNGGVFQSQQIVPVFTKDFEGISLEIRPSVARNSDIITLIIKPTVREKTKDPVSVDFNNSSGNSNGTPVTNIIQSPPEFDTRRLVTALHVKNGGTVILGGLSKEKQENRTNGVPFLSRVPVLGGFFRKDSKIDARRNLLIFVTAHIVDPGGARQGDDIQRLRDTARVVLPDDIAEGEKNLKQAETAPKPAPKNPEPAPIWRRDTRR